MQNAAKQTGSQKREESHKKEEEDQSSSESSLEDLSAWSGSRSTTVFKKKTKMASAQQRHFSQGSPNPSPRMSSATVFEGGFGEERSGTISPPIPSREKGVGKAPCPVPPPDMEDIPWYHFSISRHVAESILISTGEDGSYLLRDSASNPGEYTLSVRAKNSVKHFPVRWNGQEFTFGFGKFPTVLELVEHFASKPVIGGESGVLTLLKFPYPRCVDEPETYDQIRVHAEWGTDFRKQQKDGAPVFAIASKEGYLTKLGYHRKTWRTRWFVLFKNELKYFKTRDEKSALKTIDLNDVLDVIADDMHGKQHCFRIITTYRTFFLYAGSAQEAEEWIKILKWKLSHPKGTETAQRQGKI